MIKIKFDYYGNIINGILLGVYERQHEETYTIEKKLFGRIKTIYKTRKLTSPLYIIFIPWKHKEKELVEVDEKYILNLNSIEFEEEWIEVSSFVSKSFDGDIYYASMEVNKFRGYKFIYDYNSFIINMVLYETHKNLEVLYKHLPKLLELDLKNLEEWLINIT